MKRNKIIILIFMALLLAGCASHIAWGPNGVNDASNYTINEALDSTGRVTARTYTPFVPDRWYSDALDKLGPMMSQFSPLLEKILAYLKVASVPTVTPAPVNPAPPAPAPVNPNPPAPVPGPTPPQTASSVFSVQGSLITLDMNTLPGSMRVAGFQGTDGGLYYFAATVYAYGEVGMPDVPDLAQLHGKQHEFILWFDAEVLKVAAQMKANPALSMIVITNDGKGPDKLGFRIGPPIMSRIINSGVAANRVQLGNVVPESEY